MSDPIITKIGDVSAYLDAVAHGFEGTRAEFGELLANSANYAQSAGSAASAAVASAATATTKAGEATTAATAAQTAKTQTEAAASQALTAIGTARSSAISAVQTEGATQTANATAQAQAAATSATTASAKASEASASATTATTKASEASASATSAAQSASDAQDVLDSIPADYSEMSADVEQLKADLADIYKAFPTDTASGDVAHFDDGADGIPVKSLVVDINPVQSGSGDPSPDNVRPISGWTGMQLSTSGEDTSNPTVKAMSWETEAGTVYGGTLDVTNGVLTVNREKFTASINDTLTGVVRTSYGWAFSISSASSIYKWQSPAISTFNVPTKYIDTTVTGFAQINSVPKGRPIFVLADVSSGLNANSTVEEITNAYHALASANDVSVVYELYEPITYQLTPQEITSLLGKNNIWADTGDTAVEYRADPTLYANKLTRSHMSAIAPVEVTYTATRNYVTGDLLIVDNTLYKVTANIANGGTITPNSNVTATTLSEVISALA